MHDLAGAKLASQAAQAGFVAARRDAQGDLLAQVRGELAS